MREQIRRILGLVHAGRLSSEDAAPLLSALHPKLNLSADALAPLFALLVAEGFGPERVTDILYARTDPPRAPGAPRNPAPPNAPSSPPKPGWLGNLNMGGVDNLVERITDTVERALDTVPAASRQAPPARPGSILRVELEDESGGSFNANLPISLSAHVGKLLPPHALKALERAGLSLEALQLLLESGPPPGVLMESEDENGNELRLTVK